MDHRREAVKHFVLSKMIGSEDRHHNLYFPSRTDRKMITRMVEVGRPHIIHPDNRTARMILVEKRRRKGPVRRRLRILANNIK
jgi:hypothetical protein